MLRKAPPVMRLSLRVLAHLLQYPDAQLRAHLPELAQALQLEAALPSARVLEIQALIERMQRLDPLHLEADYVDCFDRGRSTSLHLFEHVHGDSRDRGPAMIDLIQTYEQAGLYLGADELPDHLPVLLEFASTQPAEQAREFLAETAHIVRSVFSALLRRESPYACVLAAVLELAGEKVQAVAVAADAPLDESWAEPEVFGGCKTAGQSRPNSPQVVQLIRKPHSPAPSLGVQP